MTATHQVSLSNSAYDLVKRPVSRVVASAVLPYNVPPQSLLASSGARPCARRKPCGSLPRYVRFQVKGSGLGLIVSTPDPAPVPWPCVGNTSMGQSAILCRLARPHGNLDNHRYSGSFLQFAVELRLGEKSHGQWK